MSAETLLSRLAKVKKTGPSNWIARCPAHDDGRPSLTIRELEDGTTLLHCFAECPTESVLEAVGLTFGDMFPETPTEFRRPIRRPFPAQDVIEAVSLEITVARLCIESAKDTGKMTATALDRLKIAHRRILEAERRVDGT